MLILKQSFRKSYMI